MTAYYLVLICFKGFLGEVNHDEKISPQCRTCDLRFPILLPSGLSVFVVIL